MAQKSARPRRSGARLGQHFLIGTWAAKKLVVAAQIAPEDTVLEIGPGKGALTKELLQTGSRIVAIEKDEALAEYLNNDLRGRYLEMVTGDVRDFDPGQHGLHSGKYIVAANIPYYITGEILRQFLTAREQPKRMALLMQYEVAQRIVARDKKESILSLSVKAYGTPSIAAKVGRGNFSPPPSVDSAILVIETISRTFFKDLDEDFFFRVVRAGFASKRKVLRGNLANLFEKEKVAHAFSTVGLAENIRAEDVALSVWKELCVALY